MSRFKYDKDPLKDLEIRLLNSRRIEDSCWIWTGHSVGKKKRYGQIRWNGKHELTHRISAMLYLGFDLGHVSQINHKCDKSLCFNPEHIYIGTQFDNMQDASRDGTLVSHGWRVAREIKERKLKERNALH